jgi:hypothetical protein
MTPMLTAAEIRWSVEPLRVTPTPQSDEDILVAMIAESESYRRLAQAAVHGLHEARRDSDRLRESHHRLLAECRKLREQTMRGAA